MISIIIIIITIFIITIIITIFVFISIISDHATLHVRRYLVGAWWAAWSLRHCHLKGSTHGQKG